MKQIEGLRILHFQSPVRFDSRGVFQHEFDSNYKVLEKTVKFLPKCHHYVVVPEKHNIPDDRENVTLIPFKYPRDVLSNRSHFDGASFRNLFDFRFMDFDFVFCHQPEKLYNILVSFNDKRYGQNMARFIFFHWVDCSQSRSSSAIPPSYLRQLEAVQQSDKAFFHTDISSKWLENNYRTEQTTKLNSDYVKNKTLTFPLSNDKFPEAVPLVRDVSNTIVFNHRWAKSTGVNRFEEYMEGLDYDVWCTDSKAPKEYKAQGLSRPKYRYLLENSLCSVCFVDSYATWNLSIQDGLSLKKPVLIYDHPTMRKVVGDDYPLFFKTKEDFQYKLKNLPTEFEWELPNYDKEFEENLTTEIDKILSKERKHIPKDAHNWLYCIQNDINFKNDIIEQVQPNIQLNSVWQYIRRYLLEIGVKDNINSPYVSYSIPDNLKKDLTLLTKNVKLELKPKQKSDKVVVKKHTWF